MIPLDPQEPLAGGRTDGVPLATGVLQHRASGLPMAGARVEALGAGREPIAVATTDSGGQFALYPSDTPAARLRLCMFESDPDERITVRALDRDGSAVASIEGFDPRGRERFVTLSMDSVKAPEEDWFVPLADYIQSSRRARVSDLAADLSSARPDSPVRLLSLTARAAILDRLVSTLALNREGHETELLFDDRFVNPKELRDAKIVLERPPADPSLWTRDEAAAIQWPIFDGFEWTRPDDESYRDYLRGVFVLYAHQQAIGLSGNVTQWTSVIERQLRNRFFQDFRTQDRTQVSLNKLLIPIVRTILTMPQAGSGAGLGFGVNPATVPAQGSTSDRAYLDALLALAPVTVGEFANRYRLPLGDPDTASSSPVLLNIYTLKRVLSDTAQGPVEPRENAIIPPLPGYEGKPILWDTVVTAAPFFLRFEEWLARQAPFHGENHFNLHTQVQGHLRGGPWLDQPTTNFLNARAAETALNSFFAPYFDSADEIRRSATFLLKFGAADAKLIELLGAYNAGDFRKALRLAGEADSLLWLAKPQVSPGENWEPAQTFNVNFPRSLSFARRRRLPVTNIRELSGEFIYPKKGLELFFDMPRPSMDYASSFVEARGLAVRLVKYQRGFLLPVLRALCHLELGEFASAVRWLARASGLYVGMATVSGEAGVAQLQSVTQTLTALYTEGDLPYTARPKFDDGFLELPVPFQRNHQSDEASPMGATDLHPVEERYVRLLQGEAMLRWAEVLYRTDDPSSLERARELYKGVLLLHGEDPGTIAYKAWLYIPIGFSSTTNPRRRSQLERARLALFQLEAGLNFYGFTDDVVPTLRYRTLMDAASRFASGAKSAQNDFLHYQSRLEQADLDILAARAQQKKARAYVQIASENIEIAKAGVVVAQRLVKEVEKQITAKETEIADAESIAGQYGAYLSGMKDSITSVVDIGKSAAETSSFMSIASEEEIKAGVKTLGTDGLKGVGWGGAAVVGAMAAFTAMSYVTLEGMAKEATRRATELKTLREEALPAAQAVVRVQERQLTIAQLHSTIAATELAYTADLLAYYAERFLSRDFWAALAGVARRVMSRQLDLAARAAWSAERALAYEIGRAVKIVRFDYFDARLRDVTGVDRLMLDLAELEAVRLSAAHLTVPIRRTYSLARDFPAAFGALRQNGRCTFAPSADDLEAAHPGTFAHRLRAVTVAVEAPGAVMPPRGMLSNRGMSFLKRSPGGPSLPLVRFEDGLPVSEFRVRDDMWLYQMPGEQLMAFEGSGFSTLWELEFPTAANPTGLARVSDVLITFDVRAEYAGASQIAPPAGRVSRSVIASALALDPAGLASLRGTGAQGTVRFPLAGMALPGIGGAPKITNVAVLVAGVDSGTLSASLRLTATATDYAFSIVDGLAMSNNAHLADGHAAHALNGAAGATPAQRIDVTIQKAGVSALLANVRDVALWVEYDHNV